MVTLQRAPANLALSLLVIIGLVIDAVVHLHLAPGYQLAAPGGIGQGNLFRLESVVALLVAAYVLLTGSRLAFTAATLVGLSALAAVVLYRYVDIPALGPIPSMYEPVWFFQKTLSAIAEASVGVLALAGMLLRTTRSVPNRKVASHHAA
jgi:hypothetical protein